MQNNGDDQQGNDLPSTLANPARRALAAAGYTHLDQLTAVREIDLKRLHGMGPKAIGQLRDALAERGSQFTVAAYEER